MGTNNRIGHNNMYICRAIVWSCKNKRSNNDGRCSSCHNVGRHDLEYMPDKEAPMVQVVVSCIGCHRIDVIISYMYKLLRYRLQHEKYGLCIQKHSLCRILLQTHPLACLYNIWLNIHPSQSRYPGSNVQSHSLE